MTSLVPFGGEERVGAKYARICDKLLCYQILTLLTTDIDN